ncbi:MAG: F0F1 ATP synthase subunit A [Bryobacteraceae bacterium]
MVEARVYRIIAGLGVAGAAFSAVGFGMAAAFGFAAGSVISFLNFRWMSRLTTLEKPMTPRLGMMLGGRYLLFGMAGYAILRYSEIGFLAALAVALCTLRLCFLKPSTTSSMQGHHELWVELLNNYLAAPATAVLNAVGFSADNPARPWANFIAMELLVALIIVILFAILRSQLSVDKPGKLQHIFELLVGFLRGQSEEIIGHDGSKYVSWAGTLFIFILFGNLIGVIPSFESPTMFPPVPAGCAIATFLYYNIIGFSATGPAYLKHFLGPIPWLTPLMLPIEIVSHLARPLSLTIRLYANMLAGEKVTLVFLGLTYIVAPAIFMGLHVFVSFIQAYIFAVLTMIYIGGAVEHEH